MFVHDAFDPCIEFGKTFIFIEERNDNCDVAGVSGGCIHCVNAYLLGLSSGGWAEALRLIAVSPLYFTVLGLVYTLQS